MRHLKLSAAVAASLIAVAGLRLFADDAKPAATPPAAGMPDQAAMMAAMEKFATPGPEHANLAKWVGEWETTMEDLTPGAAPGKESGTATATMILGGRVLKEEFKGSMMGQPFEGLAFTGYDNQRKQYFSTWMDTMSTGILVSWGSAAGNRLEMDGEMSCPMLDQPAKAKSVITSESDDKHVLEMTMTARDGGPMGAMRVTYTRKK